MPSPPHQTSGTRLAFSHCQVRISGVIWRAAAVAHLTICPSGERSWTVPSRCHCSPDQVKSTTTRKGGSSSDESFSRMSAGLSIASVVFCRVAHVSPNMRVVSSLISQEITPNFPCCYQFFRHTIRRRESCIDNMSNVMSAT